MHVYEDHVHCFGCGFHGDVTDVWHIMHGFEKNIDAALDDAKVRSKNDSRAMESIRESD